MADFEALVEEGVGFLLKEELFEVFEVVVVVDNAVEHEVVVVEIEVVASVADEAVVEVMGQLDCWVSLYTFPSEKGKYLFENILIWTWKLISIFHTHIVLVYFPAQVCMF